MSTTSPLQGIPLPTSDDADNVPYAMAQAVDALEKKVVMTFTTATARDAAIPTPSAGMMAYLSTPKLLTVYSGSAWGTAHDANSWAAATAAISQTNPIPVAAGSYIRYRLTDPKTVVAQVSIGASSPATGSPGNLIIAPPVLPRLGDSSHHCGTFGLYKSGNNSWTTGFVRPWTPSGTTYFIFQPPGVAVGNLGNGDGYLMQPGDLLVANLHYEAA